MKFASLGSGSKGNALLISASSGTTDTVAMLDCGFGIRETEQRMSRLGVQPSDLDAIVVTHEHKDHVGGAFKFARRHCVPVWLSHGTYQAVADDTKNVELNFCQDGNPFSVQDLLFTPFTVPHDAREPLQFHITDGGLKLGVLTDVGQATPHLAHELTLCDALMIECNHDLDMLARSRYHYSLKERIRGALGHLSNADASSLLSGLDQSRLRKVVGAHLSQESNKPELALKALRAALGSERIEVTIACQEEGFGWIDV